MMTAHDEQIPVAIYSPRAVWREALAIAVDGSEADTSVITVATAAGLKSELLRGKVRLCIVDLPSDTPDIVDVMQALQSPMGAVGLLLVVPTSAMAELQPSGLLQRCAMEVFERPEHPGNSDSDHRLHAKIRAFLNGFARRHATASAHAPFATTNGAPAFVSESMPCNLNTKFDVVAIGVSTGGPTALMQLIPKLPGSFPLPIVEVQHMPPGFTAQMAAHLDAASRLRVREAKSGDPLLAGEVLVAPGGRHMVVRPPGNGSGAIRGLIGLNEETPLDQIARRIPYLVERSRNTARPGVSMNQGVTARGRSSMPLSSA